MFEKLTKLSREGQRQEGTRTLVRGGDGAERGNWEKKTWAASCKRVEEAKTGEGDLLVSRAGVRWCLEKKELTDEEGRGLRGGFGQKEGSWFLEGQRTGARMVEDAGNW